MLRQIGVNGWVLAWSARALAAFLAPWRGHTPCSVRAEAPHRFCLFEKRVFRDSTRRREHGHENTKITRRSPVS